MKACVFWTYAIFIPSDVFVVLLWLQACSQYFIYQQQFHTHCMVEMLLTQILWHVILLNCFDSPFWQYSLFLLFPVLVTCKLQEKVHFSLLIRSPMKPSQSLHFKTPKRQIKSHKIIISPCCIFRRFHKTVRWNVGVVGQVVDSHTKGSRYQGSRSCHLNRVLRSSWGFRYQGIYTNMIEILDPGVLGKPLGKDWKALQKLLERFSISKVLKKLQIKFPLTGH